MKKSLSAMLFAWLLCAAAVISVSAAEETDKPAEIAGITVGEMSRLVDDANLLTEDEETQLLGTLDEISKRQEVDVAVITANSLDGRTAMEAADDLFDYCGYGFGTGRDGLLFLISMGEREWHISTHGYAVTAFTDAGLEFISEQFIDDLKDGNYAAVFQTYAEWCDNFITQAKTGAPYDVDNLPKLPFSVLGVGIFSLGVGFLAALFVTGIMKGRLKSVHSQRKSDAYIKKDSFKLDKRDDLFLYKDVRRRLKPKDDPPKTVSSRPSGGSTTHRSSSGATHGGAGGKF